MKPTIEQVRSHVREYYDLTLTELNEVLNTPLHPKTLRDEFAGEAMQGIISQSDNEYVEAKVAHWAYSMADAMMEARK